jgi:hypothetical protein
MSLFTHDTIAEIKADRLALGAARYLSGATLTEQYICQKLKAAEADASRRLRVLLEPTIVFAGDPTPAELTAAGSTPTLVEPAYDFDPQMWAPDRWGMFLTRQKPIISIQSIEFRFPVPITSVFSIPPAWIRADRKYGQVQIVPTGATMSGIVSTRIMQVVGGGAYVPQMVWVRYRAGIDASSPVFADLVDLVKRMAVLRILHDANIPQSGSISADGLSQSFSTDVSKYQDQVESMLDAIRDSIHGVRCMVL